MLWMRFFGGSSIKSKDIIPNIVSVVLPPFLGDFPIGYPLVMTNSLRHRK